ncbi:hypothetical protein AB0H03_22810 [Streptomyces sparsogenes]|uniref:hypothetical protein n=1 Tax=Streptomyces sparsogenes TaxID=67365 RepID=UPI0033DE24DD
MLKPTTLARYRDYVTGDLIPALGALKLDELGHRHIAGFVHTQPRRRPRPSDRLPVPGHPLQRPGRRRPPAPHHSQPRTSGRPAPPGGGRASDLDGRGSRPLPALLPPRRPTHRGSV